MISKHKILLASASVSRKKLLEEVNIPYEVIVQDADELSLDWSQSPQKLVKDLAELKMVHAILPVPQGEGEDIFVLTADTVCHDGNILGKPKTREEAIRMIREARKGIMISTGFCIEKKNFKKDGWQTCNHSSQSVTSSCVIDIPDEWINYYLDHVDVFAIAGAIEVEGVGSLFVKAVRGSYTNIRGLPLYELYCALARMQFFLPLP